jgi:hypothetical protein
VTLWFENSAHIPFVEEPGRFLAALLEHARPLAAGSRVGRRAGRVDGSERQVRTVGSN